MRQAMSEQKAECSNQGSQRQRPRGARRGRPWPWLEPEGGFTSVGVAIALALAVTLIFASAQIYWVNARSGDIQFAADAGALAAENVVAEYYIVARSADAVVLSMSLFGIAVEGVGIIASCIPGGQGIGVKIMDFGRKVFTTRDKIAKQAGQALTQLQKVLPFLAAVNSAATISANSPAGGTSYLGAALLVPFTAEDASFGDDGHSDELSGRLSDSSEKTAEKSDQAEEAKKDMDTSEYAGWLADCGASPNHCLYERATSLADMRGFFNPYFSSPESWSFSVALDRAKSYYAARLAQEGPQDPSLDEAVRSEARYRYYRYAVQEMQKGYVHYSDDGSMDAYFPLLAKNNDEVRQTRLYTDADFPLDANGCLHGSSQCPYYQEAGAGGFGSIAGLEGGLYQACPYCNLSINTIGRVGSATSNIDTGFEYHYRAVAEAARLYEEASKRFSEAQKEAKAEAQKSVDVYQEAIDSLKTTRINPLPPGRNGCIVVVLDVSQRELPKGLQSPFINGKKEVPVRMAISAAALATGSSDENLLGDFLDRAKAEFSGPAAGKLGLDAFDAILEIWGGALSAYSTGVDGLGPAVGDFLRLIHLTPLAEWAENAVTGCIKGLGLQGVKLASPKPVVVNSIHVARASPSAVVQGLVNMKTGYAALPGEGSGTIGDTVFDGLEGELDSLETTLTDEGITLFELRFSDLPGAPSLPVRIKFPAAVVEEGKKKVQGVLDSARKVFKDGTVTDVWE